MKDTVTETNEITRSFPVSGLAQLTLQNVDGQVDIAAGDDGVISVRAVRHPGPGANQTEIEISQDADGRVRVITHYLEDLHARLFHPFQHGPARVDYTVRLPKNCQVDVAVVSASARLQGLAGEFALRSVSGALDLRDLSGRLRVNTVSGAVTGAQLRLADSLRAETVSGDVSLSDSTIPAVSAHSVSGQVRLQTALGAGPYVFQSVSGDVWLDLPAGMTGVVEMHSLSGRLRASWSVSRQQTRGWTRATFGESGGPEISFHSVSGDLHLLSPDDTRAAAPETPASATAGPAAEASDRMAVLDRLARGELSVDEAVNTLKH